MSCYISGGPNGDGGDGGSDTACNNVGNNDGGNYKVKDKLVQTIKFYRVITFNPN